MFERKEKNKDLVEKRPNELRDQVILSGELRERLTLLRKDLRESTKFASNSLRVLEKEDSTIY